MNQLDLFESLTSGALVRIKTFASPAVFHFKNKEYTNGSIASLVRDLGGRWLAKIDGNRASSSGVLVLVNESDLETDLVNWWE